MDSFYIDQSTEDSRQSRSRANSHLSSTAAQFQGLNIDTASSSNDQVVTSSDTTTLTTSPPNIIEQESQPSNSTFISAPTPQQYTPFPLLSQSDLDADWSYLNSSEEQSGPAPLLRLDPVQPLLGDQSVIDHQTTFRSHSNPAAMSTVGVQQYDGRFDAGVRQSYTWPHFDMGEPFVPHDLGPGMSSGNLTPYEDPKLIPIYARSLSSSPPRASLTPEQRELKRQRDHARRNSKTRIRRDRSTSNPYIMSQKTSPDLLPRTLPEYSSSLAPAPLLSQGSPTLASPAFLTPYSPHIPESGPSDMYGPVFTMSPNDFTTVPAYSLPYPSNVGESSMQTFSSRPHSMSSASDQPNMYQGQQQSPKLGSSESGDHVRVVHSRPKPQCWEHGCNGRQFSTFSNLLRHQREKSGAAAKSTCPNCGAEFTRTTARNGHMAHEKCKQRRNS